MSLQLSRSNGIKKNIPQHRRTRQVIVIVPLPILYSVIVYPSCLQYGQFTITGILNPLAFVGLTVGTTLKFIKKTYNCLILLVSRNISRGLINLWLLCVLLLLNILRLRNVLGLDILILHILWGLLGRNVQVIPIIVT